MGITGGSSMVAMIFKRPPLLGAVFQVNLEHPLQQPGPAQAHRRRGRGRLGTAEGVWVLTGTLGKPGPGRSPAWRPEDGMISGRRLALRPRRAKQALPWAWLRVRGTRALPRRASSLLMTESDNQPSQARPSETGPLDIERLESPFEPPVPSGRGSGGAGRASTAPGRASPSPRRRAAIWGLASLKACPHCAVPERVPPCNRWRPSAICHLNEGDRRGDCG